MNKQPPIQDWSKWRERLPAGLLKTIPARFQRLVDTSAEYKTRLKDELTPGQVAVICSIYNDAYLLPGTLKELLAQLKSENLYGEIYLILNNGGGDAVEYLCGSNLRKKAEELRDKLGVDQVIYGKTDAQDQLSLEKKLPGSGERQISLVIIRQDVRVENRGKSKALRDIFRYLLKLNQEENYTPEYLLAIDSETRIRQVNLKKSRFDVITEQVRGLGELRKYIVPGRQISGSRLFMTHFDPTGEPVWDSDLPPLQHISTVFMGTWALSTLNGGATMGNFSDVMAIFLGWLQVLPGCRTEDSLNCFIVRALGLEYVVPSEVVHANLCPEQPVKAFAQFLRWRRGLATLKREVGSKFFVKIYKGTLPYLAFILMAKLRWPGFVSLASISEGLVQVKALDSIAGAQPDDWIEGDASW